MEAAHAADDGQDAYPNRLHRHPRSAGPRRRNGSDGTRESQLTLESGVLAYQLLTPDQLSEWLQVPKQTVYKWRTCGTGPRGYRVGKHLRYARHDVEQWLADQRDE